jgi:hypothetical protein
MNQHINKCYRYLVSRCTTSVVRTDVDFFTALFTISAWTEQLTVPKQYNVLCDAADGINYEVPCLIGSGSEWK